ncbi:MAG: hypothetical protein WDW36_005109 [Sanguina aurantia]
MRSKQYESKLAALTIINSALQKENGKIKRDLARSAAPPTDAEEEIQELQEEFAVRLASADRTAEGLRAEKASLSLQLQHFAAGSASSESKLAELTATVDSLREEGEALSKKNGELEAAVRRSRASTRDLEADREKLTARVRALEAQLLDTEERLGKRGAEASSQVDFLEAELASALAQAKRSVADARREAAESAARAESEAARGGEALLAASRERESLLSSSLHEMGSTMAAREEEWAGREEAFRRQLQQLSERCHALEGEAQDSSASAGDATRPLLKQIGSMAAAAAAAAAAAEGAEVRMAERLAAAQSDAAVAADSARAASSRAVSSESTCAAAQRSAAAAAAACAEAQADAQACEGRVQATTAELRAAREGLAAVVASAAAAGVEAEGARQALSERVWDSEQRARALLTERDELMRRLSSLAVKAAAPAALQAHPAPHAGRQQPPPHTTGSAAGPGSTTRARQDPLGSGLARHGRAAAAAVGQWQPTVDPAHPELPSSHLSPHPPQPHSQQQPSGTPNNGQGHPHKAGGPRANSSQGHGSSYGSSYGLDEQTDSSGSSGTHPPTHSHPNASPHAATAPHTQPPTGTSNHPHARSSQPASRPQHNDPQGSGQGGGGWDGGASHPEVEGSPGELDDLLASFQRSAATQSQQQQQQQQQQLVAAASGDVGGAGLHTTAGLGRTLALLAARLRLSEHARDDAAEQLLRAMQRADAAEAGAAAAEGATREAAALRAKVDVALELLGERNERIEAMEEDISDMRAIFHSQLEVCVGQLNSLMSTAAAAAAAASHSGPQQGQSSPTPTRTPTPALPSPTSHDT